MNAVLESELISRSQQGDGDAFSSLVEPYLGLFFAGIHRILQDTLDAQDALQEALLAIYEDLPAFQARSRFSSWAYKVCINAALMFRRSNARIREDSLDAMPSLGEFDPGGHHLDSRAELQWSVAAQALADAERRQLRECMLQALEALPDPLRVVFVLKDLEDWSTEDIAARLEQTAPAVRQRLHRARLQVQERLRVHIQGRAS